MEFWVTLAAVIIAVSMALAVVSISLFLIIELVKIMLEK